MQVKTDNGRYLVEPYGGGWVYQPDENLQIYPWSEVFETAEDAAQAARAEGWNLAADKESSLWHPQKDRTKTANPEKSF